MAFLHGKYTNVHYNDQNLTNYFNSTSKSQSVEQADASTFGREHKRYLAGIQDGSFSLGGLFDGAAGAVDEELYTKLGTVNTPPITIVPSMTPAIGDSCFIGAAVTTSYDVTSPVSDVVSVSAEMVTGSGVHTGVLLNVAAITASGDNASVDLGASPVSNDKGWFATLHVEANTMNDVTTFTIEDSANDSTFASLGSFDAVAASTTEGQTIELIPDTVNRYVRLSTSAAGTGSITAIVAFSRLI